MEGIEQFSTDTTTDTTLGPDIIIGEFPTIVDNSIEGTPEGDVLIGTESSDGISGFDGDDLIFGLDSFDFLEGGRGNDIIEGGGGDDRMFGNTGRDYLSGGSGSDNILGGRGNDALSGDRGRDFLRGGAGRDILIGGSGIDAFILEPGNGTDLVVDFEDGVDRLGIPFGTTFEDIEISQVGEDTAIAIGDEENPSVLLSGIDASLITASDFGQVVIAL